MNLEASRNIVCLLLLGGAVSCGPHHHDGGNAGSAGNDAGAATGGSVDEGGTGGSVDAGGNGGTENSAGTAGSVSAGGNGGSGNAGGRLGYDSVIGCAAARYPDAASLTLLPTDSDVSAARLSGDGKVVGGQLGGTTMRWRPLSGFETLPGLQYRVSTLNCDGSVLLTADTSGGSFRHRVGQAPEQIIPSGDYYQPEPLSVTPDGNVVVGHLIGGVDIGPHPVRWTAATGLQRISPLENTLALRVAPDAGSVVGLDPLQIFRFDFGATKEFVQAWVPSDGQHTSSILVSADTRTYFFNASPDFHSLWVDSIRQEVECPSVRCSPIAISGTGKVLVSVGPTGPAVGAPWATFVWTAQHGFRTLNDLMSDYGAPAAGTLFASAVSDDGQVFTGYIDNPIGAPYQAFYAVLPRAAYD